MPNRHNKGGVALVPVSPNKEVWPQFPSVTIKGAWPVYPTGTKGVWPSAC